MALSFLHKSKHSIVGTGAYVFRRYASFIQLSTPNVTYNSDRTLLIEPVENATFYNVYDGDTLVGSISYDGTWTPA